MEVTRSAVLSELSVSVGDGEGGETQLLRCVQFNACAQCS